MTTKEYLNQAVRCERMVRNKLLDADRFRQMALSTTVENKPDKIQSSGDKDKLGLIMSKVIDLENEVRELNNKRDLIIKQIESIKDSDEYQVLYSKYIENDNLYSIGKQIHMSKTHVYRLHDRALKNFEEKYGKTYLLIK